MDRSAPSIALLALALGGCATQPKAPPPEPAPAPPPATTPAAAPAPEVAAAEPVAEPTLPTRCAEGPMCTFPDDFAQRVCRGTHPDVALHLFAPGTPWKRAYLIKSFKAWHVGGRGDLREMRTGEEVIIAAVGKEQGMQIGGRGFDAIRWDGTCVSLMEDEITFKKPASPVPANIDFAKLGRPFQSAFQEEKQIDQLRANEKKTCELPAAEKEPQKSKCELARRALSLAIARSVGKGKELPPLAYVP